MPLIPLPNPSFCSIARCSNPLSPFDRTQNSHFVCYTTDTENVFDELKHQWGLEGFCCRQRNATALAARLGLLIYNLWHLFLRLLEPGRHVESAGGRRWFLLIAARLVHSGRQKTLQVSVRGQWWAQLRAGYERVCAWLATTAPQLKSLPPGIPIPSQIGVATP